jgi:hypothetical protein
VTKTLEQHHWSWAEVNGRVHLQLFYAYPYTRWSRDSSVGIATRCGLEGPGIESLCGEIFRTYPDRLRGPPSLLYNGHRVFPEVKAAEAWCWPHTPF